MSVLGKISFPSWQTLLAALMRHFSHFDVLLAPSAHNVATMHSRANILRARIRGLALVLAFVMPLWGVLDASVFGGDFWRSVLIVRLLAGALFASFLLIGNARFHLVSRSLLTTYLQLAITFAVPTLFYVFCNQPEDLFGHDDPVFSVVVSVYYLLPLIVLMCIGLFPLTVLEAMSVSMPLILIFYMFNKSDDITDIPIVIGMDFVMVIVAAISLVISVSQMRMLCKLVSFSSEDGLTGCLGRNSGEEILRVIWHQSVRRKTPLSIALFDLDHFKQINDSHGHKAGDLVLAEAAKVLREVIRRSDLAIRWGGEEFLIILPGSSIHNVELVMKRMRARGFGMRPDGSPLTVSAGIAERMHDGKEKIEDLISVADERLYKAKVSGRACAVGYQSISMKPENL